MSEWIRLCQVFGGDWYKFLSQILPDLEIDIAQLRQQPSRGDPLGTKSRLLIQSRPDQIRIGEQQLQLRIDKQATPWLEPISLKVYVLLQWPQLFRVRTQELAATPE